MARVEVDAGRPQELDEARERQARIERTSKAVLIRRYVGERLQPIPPLERDPLWGFFGSVEGDRGDSASVDEVVYGGRRKR